MRKEIAKDINCTIDYLTRLQGSNYLEEWQEGDILEVGKDLGLSWTDGGEFRPENKTEYMYVLKAKGNIKSHKVDYTNEEETDAIGATDCDDEKEHLIPEGTKFRVTYAPSEADLQEMGLFVVELELVEE